MAKQGRDAGRGRRSGVVGAAKRGGPGRGFWIALGVLALVGITGLSWMVSRPKAVATRLDPSLPAIKSEGYVMGSPSAPVEVIEFADFECPACGQFATVTEPDVRTRLVNTGQVRFRFMDFPLSMHKNTWDASLAAACANDQGKFWEMHDALFANQDRWNGEATSRPRGPIGDLAKGVGLDMSKYNFFRTQTISSPIDATPAGVTFHQKLGTMEKKQQRVRKLAGFIPPHLSPA